MKDLTSKPYVKAIGEYGLIIRETIHQKMSKFIVLKDT